MSDEILSREELLAELEVEGKLLEEWETLGLVRRPGRIDGEEPFYTAANLEQARQIQQLLALGYSLPDIQKIVRKVGLPDRGKGGKRKGKPTDLITVGELAELTGLNPRTIKYWEERGILLPDGRSTGGYRLYARYTVDFCLLIKSLQTFGYTLEEIKEAADLYRDYYALREGTSTLSPLEGRARVEAMQIKIALLEKRMTQLKEGIRRWEDMLKKKRKEIAQVLAHTGGSPGKATSGKGNGAGGK